MTLLYVILGVYLALMLLMGALFSGDNKDASDFIRSGARAEWWLAGTSMLVAGISAFTFTGNASAAYMAGPSLLVIYFSNILGFLFGALFLGAWLRQTRAINVPDIIRERFGPAAEQFSVVFGLVVSPFAAAMQLWALGVFMHGIFNFPLIPTLVVVGLVVTFYSLSGGRWAIMATDVIQGILLFAITLVMAYLSLRAIGGIGAFFEHFQMPAFKEDFQFFKEPGQFENNRFTVKWAVMIFIMQFYAQISLGTADRYLACKDGRDARKAALLAMALMVVGSAIWFIPPMVARFKFDGLLLAAGYTDPSAASYAFMALQLLPKGLLGLMIVGILAATMSSMDSGLANQAGIIVRNFIPAILRGVRRGPIPPDREVRLCRLMTLLVGLQVIGYAVLLATQKEIILFDAFLVFGSIVGVPLTFPLVAVLVVHKLPKRSYFAIAGGGLLASVYTMVDTHFLTGAGWTIQERTLLVLISGALVTLLCRLRYDRIGKQEKAELETFYKRLKTPVDFENEIGEPDHGKQKRMLGLSTLLLSGLLALLYFSATSPGDLWAISFVIAFVAGLGLLLLVLGRLERRKARAGGTSAIV